MLYETSAPSPTRTPASLEDYLEALRNRKYLVVVFTALALVAAVAFTNSREPVYEASSKILVNPTAEGGVNGNLALPNLEREVSIVLGDSIATQARTAAAATDPAAGTEGSVTASYSPNSDVITIKVISLSAPRSAALASAYAEAYVGTRVSGQTSYFEQSVSSIDAELGVLAPRIEEAQELLEQYDNQLAALYNEPEGTDRDVLIAQVQSNRNNTSTALNTDLARQTQLENGRADLVRQRDVQRPAAVVISTAKTPTTPQGLPNWAFWIAGLIAGFLAGAVIAFLLERLDRRAQSTRDVELAVGRPVLGAIPRFSWRFRRGRWALVMANDRKTRSLHHPREAYRRLRSTVRFLGQAERAQTIVITSNQALEGKSTTAANLAVTMALGGGTVALVSADLRRPAVERLFEIDNDRGLTDYLRGDVDSVRAERFAGLPDLAVLPAGRPVPNPGELLTSVRFSNLIERLRREFDTVIIDTPPLAAAADAIAAATRADGVILVVDGRRTETPDLLSIRNELDRSGVTLFGAIMNRDRSGSGLLRRGVNRSYYGTKSNREAPSLTAAGGERVADELTIDDELPLPRKAESASVSTHVAVDDETTMPPEVVADEVVSVAEESETGVAAETSEAPDPSGTTNDDGDAELVSSRPGSSRPWASSSNRRRRA